MKLLILTVLFAAAYAKSYDGYYTISVGPVSTKEDAKFVESLRDEAEPGRKVLIFSDFITKTSPIDMLVAPDRVEGILNILDIKNIKYTIHDKDHGKQIDHVNFLNAIAKDKMAKKNGGEPFSCSSGAMPEYYMDYAEIQAWMQCMADRHPEVTYTSIGTSNDGRSIDGLYVTTGGTKTRAVLDGTTHAREWISTTTVVYAAWRILEQSDPQASYLLNNFHWLFIPVVNPDGYEYSISDDRQWRKNRQPNDDSTCVGTDCNRNFDFHWGEEGTSPLPCQDTYGGTGPFSTPESSAVRDGCNAFQDGNLHIYISLHSYSQLWLVNWAGITEKPADYPELKEIGDRAGAAVEAVHGRFFEVGTPPDILYAASGGTYDWTKETCGAKYCYTPELRPATAAGGGFVLPPTDIVPSGEEIFAGLYTTCDDVGRRV